MSQKDSKMLKKPMAQNDSKIKMTQDDSGWHKLTKSMQKWLWMTQNAKNCLKIISEMDGQ